LFQDEEIHELEDDELIEEEPADGGSDEQTELDQRGGEIGDGDDLAAYDAGHPYRREPGQQQRGT